MKLMKQVKSLESSIKKSQEESTSTRRCSSIMDVTMARRDLDPFRK
jgi:hypothetical protein